MITDNLPGCCRACDKPIRGRTDKKYCDDYCRNNFNNRERAKTNQAVRAINLALAKNRRIMEGLILEGEEMVTTTRERLLQKGFVFEYTTHTHTGKSGSRYCFCYDHAYLPLEKDTYLVIRASEENIR